MSANKKLRDDVRAHLASIAEHAQIAKRMALTNENLTDVLDTMDNELQTVIKLVAQARGVTR